MAEKEPNDTPGQATALPLGTVDNDLLVSGSINPAGDIDFFSFTLHRGDVLGAAISSNLDSYLAVTDSNGFILMDNDDVGAVALLYPATSPLPLPQNPKQSLDAALSYICPQDGTYMLAVSASPKAANATGTYVMEVVLRRPYLETQSFFIKQTVFVDFDGPTISPMNLFGTGATSAACSPMRSFLTAWGLTAADEATLIDKTMAVIKHKFDVLRSAALNGDRPTDGVPGHYDVVFHNSKDNVNNFGQPFVTRCIIGGTIQETGLAGTLATVTSVDPGNFDPNETALVLLDLLSAAAGDPNSVNSVRLAQGGAKMDAIAQVVGVLAAHVLASTFGSFNTDPADQILEIMDAGGGGVNFWAGTGPDGIFGTADDIDMEFHADFFDPAEGIAFTPIIEDVPLVTSFGLSTGKTPGGSGPQVYVFPDLMPVSMQLSGTQLVAGEAFAVTLKIANAGAAPASNFLVSLFLNQPTATGSSAGAVQTIAVPNTIEAGDFTQVTLQGTYPAGGDFVLAVLVNADNLVAESNYMNNMLFQPVRVLSQGVDLLISKVTVTEPVPGISASFDVVVENRSITPAGPFQVGFYVNLGSAPTINDIPTATAPLAGLGAIGITSVHFDLPTQNVPRAGYAWFWADCTNQVAEDNKNNNMAKAAWGVPNDAPYFTSALTALPTPAAIGETVQFSVGAADPENDPLTFVWDFGDGATMNGGSVVTHAFSAPGTYTVRLALSDGPFNVRTASVQVEVVQSVIDLGTVHLGVRKGRFTLNVPRPSGFTARERLKSTLVSGNPGDKVRYRNFKLSGTALPGQGQQPWTYAFIVEYQSQLTHRVLRSRYRYSVVNP